MAGRKKGLSKTMTPSEFENGYWYAVELKDFATTLGIPGASKLRKDEIEKAIIGFLTHGKLRSPTKRALKKTGIKDLDIGLRANLPIKHYTSNKITKGFLIELARKQAPDMKPKSGCWYRLNRWREEQLTAGKAITYGDLAMQLLALNQTETFSKIPSGRYINFLSEFLRLQKDATHAEAIKAWKALKAMPVPKDYVSWSKAKKTS